MSEVVVVWKLGHRLLVAIGGLNGILCVRVGGAGRNSCGSGSKALRSSIGLSFERTTVWPSGRVTLVELDVFYIERSHFFSLNA